MRENDDFTGFDGKGWICDTCGKRIKNAGQGWLQWVSRYEGDVLHGRDLQIVHHSTASPLKDRMGRQGCYFSDAEELRKDGGTTSGGHLATFLGPDGLMQLLSFIQSGEAPAAQTIEVIKRLHIPGYESARPFLEQAVSEGIIEPNMPNGFYWQNELSQVIEEYGTDGDANE